VKALAVSDAGESILGEIPVSVKRGVGFEKLRLYITGKRIIVAHESKKGLGALALTPLLGRYSGSSEDSARDRSMRGGKGRVEALSPGNVLVARKDNFALSYEELVSVELNQSSQATNMTILTNQEKFQFSTNMEISEVVGLLAPKLGTRLIT
jgi:hypothetical protein